MLRVSGHKLVGRDGELRRLLDLLDDAAEGRPRHALISGDAGVGKTRLVSELAARATGRGFTVLSGRCAELGDSIPYLPLADALRAATTGRRQAYPQENRAMRYPGRHEHRFPPQPRAGRAPGQSRAGQALA